MFKKNIKEIPQELNTCHLKAGDLGTLETRAQAVQLSYFEATTLQYEIREKEEEERAGETLRSASCLLELHYSQSCRTHRESFVWLTLHHI